MKPFYNLNYLDSFLSFFKLNTRTRRWLMLAGVTLLLSIGSFFFISNFFNLIILTVLFAVCVASMFHMRYVPWLGMIDMNAIITIFAATEYGLWAGVVISHASVVGNLLVGEVEYMFFDLIAYIAMAVIAAAFAGLPFMTIAVVLCAIYFVLAFVYLSFTGLLAFQTVAWNITNFVWNMFLLLKLFPLLGLY